MTLRWNRSRVYSISLLFTLPNYFFCGLDSLLQLIYCSPHYFIHSDSAHNSACIFHATIQLKIPPNDPSNNLLTTNLTSLLTTILFLLHPMIFNFCSVPHEEQLSYSLTYPYPIFSLLIFFLVTFLSILFSSFPSFFFSVFNISLILVAQYK